MYLFALSFSATLLTSCLSINFTISPNTGIPEFVVTLPMEDNYENPDFGVTELSDALKISKPSLSKQLNTEIGVSTNEFIRNYRLEISKNLIEQNIANRNITEIAYRVGFNDPKYFTRCFSKLYGVAPSSYKGGK